ncbi:hypothetical protein ACWCRF_33560 [Streptomyces sp. NPDC002405]
MTDTDTSSGTCDCGEPASDAELIGCRLPHLMAGLDTVTGEMAYFNHRLATNRVIPDYEVVEEPLEHGSKAVLGLEAQRIRWEG